MSYSGQHQPSFTFLRLVWHHVYSVIVAGLIRKRYAFLRRRQTDAVQAAGPSGRQSKQQSKPAYFAQTPDGTRFSAQSFADLNLSRPLVKACTALGYTNPTPIQVCHLVVISCHQ